MSIHNLDAVFKPASVALIGASSKHGSVGALATRNLQSGRFAGRIMLVNPHLDEIDGEPVYADVGSTPETPDLAIIATPSEGVPELIAELGARGTKAAVVITAGFGELGPRGRILQQATLEAARPYRLRIIGPNCVGVIAPHVGLNAGFSHLLPPPGDLAFVSQSGAMVTAVLDWAAPQKIGFSNIVSLGDMADVDFGDMLHYLATDSATRGILLYIEGLKEPRKFIEAARAAAAVKPVVAVKVGRHAESARAAASHTGAMAGSDAVYDAAFRRAGILRVSDTERLFDAIETLARAEPQRGDRLAILTNGGGPGVLATDALIDAGGRLAELSSGTLKRLDAVLPPTWSKGNPVDIIGDAPGQRYVAALQAILDDSNVDAVLVLNCPTAVGDPIEAARAVISTAQSTGVRGGGRNVLTNWLGRHSAEPARALFAAAGLPTYETPDEAIDGFMQLVRYGRIRDGIRESSVNRRDAKKFSFDLNTARGSIRAALDAGRGWMDSEEVNALLTAYGIPAPVMRIARHAEEAGRVAAETGFPVVLKIRSPEITHKTDCGGVALNLTSASEVHKEALAMAARVRASHPNAVLSGFTVQQMISRPNAVELIVGVAEDRTFGPVVLFGHGGVAVQALNDSALELPPVTEELARAQISRTRVSKLLNGFRNRPPADISAIADVLVRVSHLVSNHAEICELDINPLIADERGVLALDARVRVQGTSSQPSDRLAILPD